MKVSNRQVEEMIETLIKKQCGEDVSRDKELLVSGVIGSFQLFEMICDLEEIFDIRFRQEDLKEISHFSSVNAIMNTIKKYMA